MIWVEFFNQFSKTSAMILVFEMTNFVDDDVSDELCRQMNEIEIE